MALSLASAASQAASTASYAVTSSLRRARQLVLGIQAGGVAGGAGLDTAEADDQHADLGRTDVELGQRGAARGRGHAERVLAGRGHCHLALPSPWQVLGGIHGPGPGQLGHIDVMLGPVEGHGVDAGARRIVARHHRHFGAMYTGAAARRPPARASSTSRTNPPASPRSGDLRGISRGYRVTACAGIRKFLIPAMRPGADCEIFQTAATAHGSSGPKREAWGAPRQIFCRILQTVHEKDWHRWPLALIVCGNSALLGSRRS
jgi:hypothetical protein